jgi:hypothetical protein
MRCLLLVSAAVLLVLVPAGAGAFAAFSPHPRRILPVGFWILWLLLSLWAMFYAPVVVGRLTPRNAGNHRCASYARWGIALALINLAWSLAEIVWLA